ncbi:MAG: F0F1 ATP synthase subunit B [Sporichthyaceae bacterium]
MSASQYVGTAGTAELGTGELILAAGAKAQIIEFIGFAIVMLVLLRYIVPVVGKLMTSQQEAIATKLAASEAAAEKLAEAKAAYDNAIAEAKAEAERLRVDAQLQHDAIVAESAASAQAKADEITARSREALEAERVQAIRTLQAEIAGLVVSTAERAVLDSLSDDALQRRITDRFLAQLESGSLRGSAKTGGPA